MNTRHISIILALLLAGPMLRAQSSLIDTAGLAARIPFPPDARILDRPIAVRFSARLDMHGVVDSVTILDTAHRASPFGNAVRTIVGTRARRIDDFRPATVEMIASFGLEPVNGRRLKRVNVRVTASVSDTTQPLGTHAHSEYPAPPIWAKGGPGIMPPSKDHIPAPYDSVIVDTPSACDMVELMRRVRYPVEARDRGIQGVVEVRCLINKYGKVTDAIIARSDNPLLNDAAVEAVRNTPFLPAIRNRMPVFMWVTIPIRFALK